MSHSYSIVQSSVWSLGKLPEQLPVTISSGRRLRVPIDALLGQLHLPQSDQFQSLTVQGGGGGGGRRRRLHHQPSTSFGSNRTRRSGTKKTSVVRPIMSARLVDDVCRKWNGAIPYLSVGVPSANQNAQSEAGHARAAQWNERP